MPKKFAVLVALGWAALGLGAFAQNIQTTVTGTVVDGVGRAVAAATVTISDLQGKAVETATTGANGGFAVSAAPGSYALRVDKPSFASATSIMQVGGGAAAKLRITLDIAPMQQSLVVAATGVATPATQLGQTVAVLDRDQLAARDGLSLDQALQEVAGVQIVRTGATGGLSEVSLRGADPSFNQVVIDGVPVQRFDYGAFDFSTLMTAGLESVTVVQGADSVVYGGDAASGVIDIRSRSGAGLASPQLTLNTMSGSYGTVEQTAELLGQTDPGWLGGLPLDYGFTFGYLDTQNQIPNDKDWNQTWAGNVGIRLPKRASLRLNLHRIATRAGSPNAYEFFGIADDSMQSQGETYGSARLQQQTTSRWSNEVTVSQANKNYFFDTIQPSGTPFDPFGYGANYLGNTVTIVGANGYSTTGQAILDYGGAYPSLFNSDTVERNVAAESTYSFSPQWKLTGGYRYKQEEATTPPTVGWHDNGAFAEVSGGEWNRVFGSAGLSEDAHSVFGHSVNPQASLAVLPRLHRGGWWNEIRLHANAATGTVDPTVTDEQSSLYQVVAGAEGTAAAAGLNLGPIHPERSHTFDLGADQYFARDAGRLSLTWFDNRYDDLIQFVPNTAFGALGIPNAVANAAEAEGGAYLNSLSESSKGLETELAGQHAAWGGVWHGSVSYTYLIPVVLHSFSSDAISPAINPAFPNIPIGAFAPLVGARPFHVAPESGSVMVDYHRARWTVAGSTVVSSRRDDSTFLSDGYDGDSMLLPNHDLAPAYTALNLSGTYDLTARFTLEGVMENALNQNYQETFGYPSLGRAVRVGVKVRLGGGG